MTHRTVERRKTFLNSMRPFRLRLNEPFPSCVNPRWFLIWVHIRVAITGGLHARVICSWSFTLERVRYGTLMSFTGDNGHIPGTANSLAEPAFRTTLFIPERVILCSSSPPRSTDTRSGREGKKVLLKHKTKKFKGYKLKKHDVELMGIDTSVQIFTNI